MTRTNFNHRTSELNQQAKDAMFKRTSFYLIPHWLDDALQAHSLNETILSDGDKVKSILTDDDIKFYNQNVCDMESMRKLLPLCDDINFQTLQPIARLSYPSINVSETPSYEENSISKKKEKLSPFIRDIQNFADKDLWNVVLSYSINRLADHNLVGVRLSIVPYVEASEHEAKQNEMLAEFSIAEYGLMAFAGTHLFKKILETKSCY